MAAVTVSQSGHVAYGQKEFIVDTVEDLDKLLLTQPANLPMGCTALVIETSQVFILGGDKQWKELK